MPGRFYFGMERDVPQPTTPLPIEDRRPTAEIESYGVHRSQVHWGSWGRVHATLADDNARRRLSWISVRPPAPSVDEWRAVASGAHDHVIYELAKDLATETGLPALISFDAEPTDAADADGPVWAAAYCRFHDIIASATGLRLVGEAPIVSDWLFNPANPRRRPECWLTDEVLQRSSLLGLTVHENASGEGYERRIPRVLEWLDSRGFATLMIGVAASGRTEYAPPYVDPRTWLNDSLDWVARNTDRVSIVCYSSTEKRTGAYWAEGQLGRASTCRRRWVDHAITRS